jgi:DNA topoisomerase VI subunit B
VYIAPKKRPSEVLQAKSPAEFFAENQHIAGFDNVSITEG